jgi:hypothetical protein
MVTAKGCRGRLGKPVELVDMDQIDFPRLPESSDKAERDCHRRELHGKNPGLIRAGLIEPAWPGGIERNVMAVFCQSRAHRLGGFDGAPLDWIERVDNMKQTQPVAQKFPLSVVAMSIRPEGPGWGLAGADKARNIKQIQVSNPVP